MKKSFFSKQMIYLFVSALIISLLPGSLMAQSKQSIAILPFEIISSDDISYIQDGALQMLHSRLYWKDHTKIVDKYQVKKHLKSDSQTTNNATIKKIADQTQADFVLTGSLVQFSNAFSIDAKIYDIKNKQYLSFFEQSKTIDDLIPKLNLIAAKINKKVFERETLVYENLLKKEKEKARQLRRQNPENLMPSIPENDDNQSPSRWKFWEYL